MRQLLVAKISSGPRHTTSDEEKPITFTTKDKAGISYPHDDSIVIAAMIGTTTSEEYSLTSGALPTSYMQ